MAEMNAWGAAKTPESGQEVVDPMPPFPAMALSALLDRDDVPTATLPLPWHWLYALTATPAGGTGPDGHPARCGFLPNVDLPRRMWAASEVDLIDPIALNVPATRMSTVASFVRKAGRSGELVFVTVDHRWIQHGSERIRERQTIVYRGTDGSSPPPAASPETGDLSTLQRTVTPDAVMLFRYSALTYNSHRIHYDRPYAEGVEGYPGLVVQGPLIATLLMEAARPLTADRPATRFTFRAERPAFVDKPLLLHAREAGASVEMWSTDEDGVVGMRALLELAENGQ